MRLYNDDGIEILSVNAEQLAVLREAYKGLGCVEDYVGGGVVLMTEKDAASGVFFVAARFRLDRTN